MINWDTHKNREKQKNQRSHILFWILFPKDSDKSSSDRRKPPGLLIPSPRSNARLRSSPPSHPRSFLQPHRSPSIHSQAPLSLFSISLITSITDQWLGLHRKHLMNWSPHALKRLNFTFHSLDYSFCFEFILDRWIKPIQSLSFSCWDMHLVWFWFGSLFTEWRGVGEWFVAGVDIEAHYRHSIWWLMGEHYHQSEVHIYRVYAD